MAVCFLSKKILEYPLHRETFQFHNFQAVVLKWGRRILFRALDWRFWKVLIWVRSSDSVWNQDKSVPTSFEIQNFITNSATILYNTSRQIKTGRFPWHRAFTGESWALIHGHVPVPYERQLTVINSYLSAAIYQFLTFHWQLGKQWKTSYEFQDWRSADDHSNQRHDWEFQIFWNLNLLKFFLYFQLQTSQRLNVGILKWFTWKDSGDESEKNDPYSMIQFVCTPGSGGWCSLAERVEQTERDLCVVYCTPASYSDRVSCAPSLHNLRM